MEASAESRTRRLLGVMSIAYSNRRRSGELSADAGSIVKVHTRRAGPLAKSALCQAGQEQTLVVV